MLFRSGSGLAKSAPNLVFGKMNDKRKVVEIKEQSVYNGIPTISFNEEEVSSLSLPFAQTRVGKFSYGIPKIFEVTKMLKDLILKAPFTVSILDKRHVAIRLTLEEDVERLWLLENPTVGAAPIRFFKWSPMFFLLRQNPP